MTLPATLGGGRQRRVRIPIEVYFGILTEVSMNSLVKNLV